MNIGGGRRAVYVTPHVFDDMFWTEVDYIIFVFSERIHHTHITVGRSWVGKKKELESLQDCTRGI